MKYGMIFFVLAAAALGVVYGLSSRSSSDVGVVPSEFQTLQSIRLSVDYQDQPLITYSEVVAESQESLADMLERVLVEQGNDIELSPDSNEIVRINEYNNSTTRSWQVYVNGVQVDNLMHMIVSNDMVEVQYEQQLVSGHVTSTPPAIQEN